MKIHFIEILVAMVFVVVLRWVTRAPFCFFVADLLESRFWQRISCLVIVPGLLLVCFIGIFAVLTGLNRLDRWCQRQLTDGQAEEDAQ